MVLKIQTQAQKISRVNPLNWGWGRVFTISTVGRMLLIRKDGLGYSDLLLLAVPWHSVL